MNKDYDVIILGGGVAGYYSAKALRQGGRSVALLEKEALGGTALRWGALPVKRALDFFKERKGPREALLTSWQEDLRQLNFKLEENLLALGVDLYYGEGELLDAQRVKVGEESLKADYII